MSHPEPTFETPTLFVSGSYGVDVVNSMDGLKVSPTEGWAVLEVIDDAVLTAITFGGDVSGGSKLVGPTLVAGTIIWAHILSIHVASGTVALNRGRKNPEGMPSSGIDSFEAEMASYTETYLDGSAVVVHWGEPGVVWAHGYFDVYRDGSLIAGNISSSERSHEDPDITSGETYEYQVIFVYFL